VAPPSISGGAGTNRRSSGVAYRFHTYIDNAKQWRWQLKAENGKIVADSGEGYSTLGNCREAATRVRTKIADAEID
jgi:uncharacterized protein YegP (UPF0339 family)